MAEVVEIDHIARVIRLDDGRTLPIVDAFDARGMTAEPSKAVKLIAGSAGGYVSVTLGPVDPHRLH